MKTKISIGIIAVIIYIIAIICYMGYSNNAEKARKMDKEAHDYYEFEQFHTKVLKVDSLIKVNQRTDSVVKVDSFKIISKAFNLKIDRIAKKWNTGMNRLSKMIEDSNKIVTTDPYWALKACDSLIQMPVKRNIELIEAWQKYNETFNRLLFK